MLRVPSICHHVRFETYFVRHRSHTCWLIYQVLLPSLGCGDVSGSGAGSTTPQRAGTCYAKCMFLALRTLLAELGVSKLSRRRILFNFRFFFLEKMVKDLDRIQQLPDHDDKLTISDRIMLTVAIKQVARRCVRDTEASSALERAHLSLQKIWLAAPPMRWLGFFTREKSSAPVTVDFDGACGQNFVGFRLHFLSALIPTVVSKAFAGPTASKASNPHVDLTGIASAEAAGPSLEVFTQALVMCDPWCNVRKKFLKEIIRDFNLSVKFTVHFK